MCVRHENLTATYTSLKKGTQEVKKKIKLKGIKEILLTSNYKFCSYS